MLQHRAGAAVFVLFILDAMLKDEFAQPSKTPELFIHFAENTYGSMSGTGIADVYATGALAPTILS